MAQGKISGFAWHVEKSKGYNTKKKTCFNCIYFDEQSCRKHGIHVTNNNALYCISYENENDNENSIEKVKTISYENTERYKTNQKILENFKSKKIINSKKPQKELTPEEKKLKELKEKQKKKNSKIWQEYRRNKNLISKYREIYKKHGLKTEIEKINIKEIELDRKFKEKHFDILESETKKAEKRKMRREKRRLKIKRRN